MNALLEVNDLVVEFRGRGRKAGPFRAVDGIQLSLDVGGALGVVGESGCGKSTTASAIVGLVPVAAGQVVFDGQVVSHRRRNTDLRGRIQMVFQDPAGALNPRMRVRTILSEIVLLTDGPLEATARQDRLAELMTMVELPVEYLERFPRSLSGGQRQRVSIARALASRPELLILDEAIAALDVSVQAAIIELLARLRRELRVAIIFISHNLGAVRSLCDSVAVMYAGKIVEQGHTSQVLAAPRHDYTHRLLAAEPAIR